jgi:peptidoglycan hydrolase-like protein with peptidoglycan-binding domain
MAQDRVPRSSRLSRAGARTAKSRPSKSSTVRADARAELLLRLQAHAGNNAVSELLEKPDALTVQRLGVGLLPAGVIAAGPAAAVAAIAPPKLKLGSKGPAVKDVQEKLNATGAALIVDSIFGGQTKTAVMAFQSDQGLKATGVVDAATHVALAAPAAGTQAAVGLGRYKPWESKLRWNALTKAERDNWAILGWNKADWDAHHPPPTATKAFKDLTPVERGAAVQLGYIRASWDRHWDVASSKAPAAYTAEESAMRKKAGKGVLPAGMIGSLRARAILDAEFGDLATIKLPEVHLLNDAGMKKAYEGFYGAGSYPAGGLRGFQKDGIYLNQNAVWKGTTVHESLHKQEHTDWDGFAYSPTTSIGEGATTVLTETALTNQSIAVTTHSYPDEVSLVSKMNTHSSLDHMKKAYFQGGANIATYRSDVTAGLIAGKTWANFRALVDARSLAAAKALLK